MKSNSTPIRYAAAAAAAVALTLLSLRPAVSTNAASPTSCEKNSAYRALDFSLGSWTVAVPGFSGKSTSEIRRDVRGCAIVENWSGAQDAGLNIDAYNVEDQHWHRFFVDSLGKVHTFEGVARNGSIDYRGTSREPDGKIYLNRLELRSEGRDKIAELWQKSPDGKVWSTAFEGIYSRVGP